MGIKQANWARIWAQVEEAAVVIDQTKNSTFVGAHQDKTQNYHIW